MSELVLCYAFKTDRSVNQNSQKAKPIMHEPFPPKSSYNMLFISQILHTGAAQRKCHLNI